MILPRWLKAANGFMLSARVIWDELMPDFGADAFADNEAMDRVLAFWGSYLLLTAYAFENLYRAVLSARGSSWRVALGSKGGHGLTQQITSLTALDGDEANLLDRLETYLVWAGRYVVPKDVRTYDEALRQGRIALMDSDLGTAERLFGRLEHLIANGRTGQRSN